MGLGGLIGGLLLGALTAGGTALIQRNQQKKQEQAIMKVQQEQATAAIKAQQEQAMQMQSLISSLKTTQSEYAPKAPAIATDLDLYAEAPEEKDNKANTLLKGLSTIYTSPLGDTSEPYTGRRKLLGN